jgi:hypothetical protein
MNPGRFSTGKMRKRHFEYQAIVCGSATGTHRLNWLGVVWLFLATRSAQTEIPSPWDWQLLFKQRERTPIEILNFWDWKVHFKQRKQKEKKQLMGLEY